MNYYLYKLAFDTAVHFGGSSSALSLYSSEDHFCADTLFSALCHTALSLHGQEGLDSLCQAAQAGKLLLSDSMPWKGDAYYLPRPTVSFESQRETPADRRKAIKKLRWVPAEDLTAFLGGVYSGEQAEFGISTGTAKVKLAQDQDSQPYQVGVYRFLENAGLWFLAGCETEELGDTLQRLMEGLSYTGIGGKTSAGYGKFHVEDQVYLNEPFDGVTKWLYTSLNEDAAPRQLLLTTSLPSDEELEALLPQAEYMLTRRGGFVQSAAYGQEARRKASQLFLSAGSVLPGRFRPRLYQVGTDGNHPVYRLSGPLFLGVTL